jgi:exopolysaccharide biosynthesis polyprenyl glycosylphosphotransferase
LLTQRNPTQVILAMLADAVSVVLAFRLAVLLRDVLPLGKEIPEWATIPAPVLPLAACIWLLSALLFSVYDPKRRLDELQNVVTGAFFALLVLAGALYFSFRDVSRLLVVYFAVLALAGALGWRLAARLLRRGRARRAQRVLVVGADEIGAQVGSMVAEYAWTGLKLVGFVADETPAQPPPGPILGRLNDVQRIVAERHIDEVIITLPFAAYDRLNALILDLGALPVQVRIAPNYLNLVLYRATVQNFSGMPLINLRDPALTSYQRVVKRAFDLAITLAALPLVVPPALVIAWLIGLDSPGPVIFRQRRVGENGRLFTMYKFRTMHADAADQPASPPVTDNLGRIVYKVEDDPRVTRVGRVLRRTSLDELPQLWNVLRGDMSLVGPRPEMPWLVEKYEPWQRKRFAIPQGMTGWWQVNGRADKPMYLHTEDDLYYIQNYSLLLDIVILWRTVFVVLRRRGAF